MKRLTLAFAIGSLLVFCPCARSGFAWESGFLVSPDGSQLVFSIEGPTSDSGPPYHILSHVPLIRTRDTSGWNEREIGEMPPSAGDIFWLDANRVATPSSTDERRYHVLTLDGETQPDLVLPKGCDVLYKRLSPDRRSVAFVGRYVSEGEKTHGLFQIDLATQTVKPILIGAYKTAPAWSPDSTRLAIGSGEGYVADHELLIVDVAHGHVTKTGVEGVGAEWSADGRRIAFSTELRSGGSWHRGIPVSGRIGFLDIASFDAYAITPTARLRQSDDGFRQEMSGALGPLWSQDGEHIAYRETVRYHDNRDSEADTLTGICIANTDEMGGVLVYEGDARYAWAPDSRSLYLLTGNAILKVDLPTFESRTLVSW